MKKFTILFATIMLALNIGGIPYIINTGTNANTASFGTNFVGSFNTTSRSFTNFNDLQFSKIGAGGLPVASWGAQSDNSSVLGGTGNKASGVWSVICGGRGGTASGTASFIGVSYPDNGNNAQGGGSAIVNGQDCIIDNLSFLSFIGNGNDCQLLAGRFGFIGTGDTLILSGQNCAIVGGSHNTISDGLGDAGSDFSFIGGGINNTINLQATNAFLGGGSNNVINGNYSAILAGVNNTVSGSNAMAIGYYLTENPNNTIGIGVGAHKLEIGTTGQTNADVFVPNGGILGVANASSATAGNVGEVVNSKVANGSSVTTTSGSVTNVTTITLSAGDWDVQGVVSFAASSATITELVGGISTTSQTMPSDGTEVYSFAAITTASLTNSVTCPVVRINVNTTTTVYLEAKPTFSAGTLRAFGYIYARRQR